MASSRTRERPRAGHPPDPPAARAPGVPGPVAAVVMRALATDPAQRFATAESFGVALAGACTQAWGPGWLPDDVPIMDAGPIMSAAGHPAGGGAAPAAGPVTARAESGEHEKTLAAAPAAGGGDAAVSPETVGTAAGDAPASPETVRSAAGDAPASPETVRSAARSIAPGLRRQAHHYGGNRGSHPDYRRCNPRCYEAVHRLRILERRWPRRGNNDLAQPRRPCAPCVTWLLACRTRFTGKLNRAPGGEVQKGFQAY